MKKISLLLTVLLIFLAGCQTQPVNLDIDGYQKADYKKYTSSETATEANGDKIYIEGKILKTLEESYDIYAQIEDEQSNIWYVSIGTLPAYTTKGISELEGESVRAFGSYIEPTDGEFTLPTITILYGGKIEFTEKEKDSYTPQEASKEEIYQWVEENGQRFNSTDLNEGKYNGTYVFGYGVATDSTQYTSLEETGFYLYQKNENGMDSKYLSYNYGELGFDPVPSIEGGLKVYGYVDEKGEMQLLAYEPYEADFTAQDIVNDYKASCQSYSYKTIARDPDQYKGQKAVFTGKVVQVMESGGSISLRVNVTKARYFYEDTVYVSYSPKDGEGRILEDDIITMWGTLDGIKTYETVMGASVSIPQLNAKYIQIK